MRFTNALWTMKDLVAEDESPDALTMIIASDFVRGGAADFARVVGDAGAMLTVLRRQQAETWLDFFYRLRELPSSAGKHVLVGGIDPAFNPDDPAPPAEHPNLGFAHWPIALPDGPLHPAQRRTLRHILDHRRAIVRAGRRWGKSALMCAIAADGAMLGQYISYVCPQYKTAAPVFAQLDNILSMLISRRDRGRLEIQLSTGGTIDVLSIESGLIIGRGRKFHRIIADEIAHVLESTNLPLIWSSSLAPTLLDYRGSAIATSTPFGTSPANWFFQISTSKELGWGEIVYPTSANPFMDPAELEEIQSRSNPLIWRQEYCAEFTSLDGERSSILPTF